MKLLAILAIASFGISCQAQDQIPFALEDGIEPREISPRQSDCTCGRRNGAGNRIVGGVESIKNEFPWRVAVSNQDDSFFCTATLLDDRFVMCAAHCVKAAEQRGWSMKVSIGDHDLQSSKETTNQTIDVSDYRAHPDYNPNTYDSDIAILLLAKSAQMSQTVSPVCLPYKYENATFTTQRVTASGWGVTGESRRDSARKLQKVDLDLITNQRCQDMYRSSGIQITKNMICTYTYANGQGKDTCQGDSGGSIDYLESATKNSYAVGVVSFGEGCARENKPGVYCRVMPFLKWIEYITQRTFCGSPNRK